MSSPQPASFHDSERSARVCGLVVADVNREVADQLVGTTPALVAAHDVHRTALAARVEAGRLVGETQRAYDCVIEDRDRAAERLNTASIDEAVQAERALSDAEARVGAAGRGVRHAMAASEAAEAAVKAATDALNRVAREIAAAQVRELFSEYNVVMTHARELQAQLLGAYLNPALENALSPEHWGDIDAPQCLPSADLMTVGLPMIGRSMLSTDCFGLEPAHRQRAAINAETSRWAAHRAACEGRWRMK